MPIQPLARALLKTIDEEVEMVSMRAPAAQHDSNVDTILTLPEQTGAIYIANACREAALAFLNESQRWGKPELAMWLMGPYAQLTQYDAPASRRRSGEFSRSVPMLREIDVRMVERVVKSARNEVLETLRHTGDLESGTSFAFTMLSSGFVSRCEDKSKIAGWVPTREARRLADRVLSLLAADYLTRPHDYENELSLCSHCETVDFDSISRMRGICHRHGSGMFVPRSPRSTLPYLPEGA